MKGITMEFTKTETRNGEFGSTWLFANGSHVEQILDGIDVGIVETSYRYIVASYLVVDAENNEAATFSVDEFGSWRKAQRAAFEHARSL